MMESNRKKDVGELILQNLTFEKDRISGSSSGRRLERNEAVVNHPRPLYILAVNRRKAAVFFVPRLDYI